MRNWDYIYKIVHHKNKTLLKKILNNFDFKNEEKKKVY